MQMWTMCNSDTIVKICLLLPLRFITKVLHLLRPIAQRGNEKKGDDKIILFEKKKITGKT